jgi:hypothetical protein
MTQLGADASVIDLGVPGTEDQVRGRWLPRQLRRRLLIAFVTLGCLLTVAASARGGSGLNKPLWTGSVSLNGFTVGANGLYRWSVDGKAVTAFDLSTGRPRWSRDLTELPDSIVDLGNGIVLVVTRPLSSVGAGWPGVTITLVREASGERIAQTTGDYYAPSADGRLLLVYSRRLADPDSCGATDANCQDITAWDVHAGAVAWTLHLPPGADFLPSFVDGGVEALAEIGADGTVRVRELSTGAVVGSVTVSAGLSRSGGQIGLVNGAVLTAQRGPGGITVTGYRLPSLARSWSVTIADFTPITDQGGGELYLGNCPPDACMEVNGAGFWVINPSTGSVTNAFNFQVFQRLGGGAFLAAPTRPESSVDGMPGRYSGLVLGPDGRILSRLGAVTGMVDWSDSGGRAMVTREGPERTDFQVIDDRGHVRTLDSVPGIGLTCHAHGDVLACSNAGGGLRVWRLPL